MVLIDNPLDKLVALKKKKARGYKKRKEKVMRGKELKYNPHFLYFNKALQPKKSK